MLTFTGIRNFHASLRTCRNFKFKLVAGRRGRHTFRGTHSDPTRFVPSLHSRGCPSHKTLSPNACTMNDGHTESDDCGSDDEAIAMMVIDGTLPGFSIRGEKAVALSFPRVRRANKDRDFNESDRRFTRLYFGENPVYDENDFERRFRMPRGMFNRIFEGLNGKGIFVRREDACGKIGISPRMRIIAALRILAYGKAFDEMDELCEMSENSARESFYSFLDGITDVFGPEYLRHPNEEDLKRILSINAGRGFPGCLGSWDCQHWPWKNCPVAWAGQFKGKEKQPTVVLEAIADGELWIWGCNFGSPGSLNDINVLDTSPLRSAILEGKVLPGFKYVLNNKTRECTYYLVDGIYPLWAIFVTTISEPSNRKERRFSAAQEAHRKDVERAFGVLVSRWGLLAKPCTLWNRVIIRKVVQVAVILHNMIVQLRRGGYESQLCELFENAVNSGMFLDNAYNEKPFIWRTKQNMRCAGANETSWSNHIAVMDEKMKDDVAHFSLKKDLLDHIWSCFGEN